MNKVSSLIIHKLIRKSKISLQGPQLQSTQQNLNPTPLNETDPSYHNVEDIAFQLQKNKATNIALTGPYGSGKSSIILTLLEKFPNFHYLKISLATLKANDEQTESKNKEQQDLQNLNRLIEYSILQQLIYREKQDTLPNSRFKRIFQLSNKDIKKYPFCITIAIAASIILFEPSRLRVDWICQLLGFVWLNILGDSLSLVYLIWFSYKIFQKFIKTYSNSKLNKLNLKEGEIEVVENTSIFNKHLDEILYFFQMTKYDVVIIEDLDRFNTSDIFIKLRELNILLNESAIVERDRKITFIYAVRDDMFTDSDRSKCFDYISTVIPVINRSNAKEQLKYELSIRGIDEIKDEHIRELGFFIDDMRLLKNIANEYVQYKQKIVKNIKAENLLSMVIYKNYFPRDFAELHNCKGVVYSVIHLKEIFIKKRLESIDGELAELEKERNLRIDHQHLSEKELRTLYLYAYQNRFSNKVSELLINGEKYSINDISDNEELFNILIQQSSITGSYYNSYWGRQYDESINVSFETIQKSVHPGHSYEQRLAAIRDTEKALIPKFTQLDIKREETRSQTIQELMNNINYGELEEYKKLDVPPLIEFLILHGYIDENYYDYISIFYPNMISQEDYNYILNIKLKKPQPYDYVFQNIANSIEEIEPQYYREKYTLNYHILDYLAEKSQTDRTRLGQMSLLLKTAIKSHSYPFLAGYFNNGKQQDTVFNQLFSLYNDLWKNFISIKDNYNLIRIWTIYAEETQCTAASKQWYSENFQFLIENQNLFGEDRIIQLIKKHNYQFHNISIESKELMDAILENQAYELNHHNTLQLVNYLLDRKSPDDESLSYTTISSTQNKYLIDCIQERLEIAVEEIFTEPASKNESSESILFILESDNIQNNVKLSYLSNQENKIDFNDIQNDKYKNLAIQCGVINPTWNNIFEAIIYNGDNLTDELIAYIGIYSNNLSNQSLPNKDATIKLLSILIMSNRIPIESYTKIATAFKSYSYSQIQNIELEENRIDVLIQLGMIEYNVENINYIQEHYSSDTLFKLIIKNKSTYINHVDQINYNKELVILILKSNVFSKKEKIQIIPLMQSNEIDDTIAECTLDILRTEKVPLPFSLSLKLLQLAHNIKNRISLIADMIEYNEPSEEQIGNLLTTLPLPFSSISEYGKRPSIPNNAECKRLVSKLKQVNYISSYQIDNANIRINTLLKPRN